MIYESVLCHPDLCNAGGESSPQLCSRVPCLYGFVSIGCALAPRMHPPAHACEGDERHIAVAWRRKESAIVSNSRGSPYFPRVCMHAPLAVMPLEHRLFSELAFPARMLAGRSLRRAINHLSWRGYAAIDILLTRHSGTRSGKRVHKRPEGAVRRA